MCGIVGYLGDQEAWPIILNGLSQLEYRGYDSAGIAVLDTYGRFSIKKTTGRVQSLVSDDLTVHPQGTIALGHTRWATHGPPSYDNAHPHVDCSQRVAVVHNGIIENFLDLKNRLESEGHIFSSETDSEVIPHLIEVGLSKGNDFNQAFRDMAKQLKGSQAIVALSQSPEQVLCGLRLGYAGGLVIAKYKGETILGSALPAMLPLFDKDLSSSHEVVFLESEEMVTVTRLNTTYHNLDGHILGKEPVRVAVSDLSSDKGNYSHFMLKEIMEQPDVVGASFKERVDFYNKTITLSDLQISDADIVGLNRVILVGCGTSLHAAQIGRSWIEEFGGIPASAESASEFRYNHLTVDSKTLVITIGQSGETADTIAAMEYALLKGARLITICNSEGSQATRIAESTLNMQAGLEIGVASTKTFLASLCTVQILAIYLGQIRGALDSVQTGVLIDNLSTLPRILGDLLKDSGKYKDLAKIIGGYDDFLFLGRGTHVPIAYEGALKLKEISYIHAEGYAAGEMKHGPIALIDSNMATLALAPKNQLYDKMLGNILEVKARDGMVAAILTEGDVELGSRVDVAAYIPPAPESLLPMVLTIPLQLVAYYVALAKGCDVDKPRNLAKSVTVE